MVAEYAEFCFGFKLYLSFKLNISVKKLKSSLTIRGRLCRYFRKKIVQNNSPGLVIFLVMTGSHYLTGRRRLIFVLFRN